MMHDLTLVYEGSLKRVWNPLEREERLWFEYADDYSLFGWRQMPDRIRNRARALTVIASYLFEQLTDASFWKQMPVDPSLKPFRNDWLDARWQHLVYSHVLAEHGVPTHYQGLVGADGQAVALGEAAESTTPVYLEVLAAKDVRPEPYKILGQKVFHYAPTFEAAPTKLIPLTVTYQFGAAPEQADSCRLEIDSKYLSALDIKKVPAAGERLERPILQFFAGFEPFCRRLSVQEALLVSGLTAGQFEELVELSYAIALGLFVVMAQRDLELWQGNLQFARGPEGLMLVDCPEPDEMILLSEGSRLSLDFVSRFYQGSKWQAAMQEAQKKAEVLGRPDWQDICSSKLKAVPDPLPEPMKAVCDQLYGTLANQIVGRDLFGEQPSLHDLSRSIKES